MFLQKMSISSSHLLLPSPSGKFISTSKLSALLPVKTVKNIVLTTEITSFPTELNYRIDAGEVYRYDQRPPQIIMSTGFQGTISKNNVMCTFGEHTVFASTSLEGGQIFLKSAQEAVGHNKTFYLYKIDTDGMRTLSFLDNYRCEGDLFIKKLAYLKFVRNVESYSVLNKFNRLGVDGFCNYLADKLRDPIIEAFLPVNEIHIEGPISPKRISSVVSD